MLDRRRLSLSKRRLVLVLGAWIAACDEEEGAVDQAMPLDSSVPSSTCDDVHTHLLTKLRDDPVLGALRACDRDEDCVRLSVELRCSEQNLSVASCGAAIASTQLEAGQAWLRATHEELCVGGPLPSACSIVYRCAAIEPLCVAHLCTLGRKGVDAGTP